MVAHCFACCACSDRHVADVPVDDSGTGGKGRAGASRALGAGFTRASPRPASSGPQNCAACVHEGIYEDGVSILESSSVSREP